MTTRSAKFTALLFIAFAMAFTPIDSANGSIVLIDDDFSSSTIANGGLSRDQTGWRKGSSSQTWDISGGQLCNDGGSTHSDSTTRQRHNEAAIAQVIDTSSFVLGDENQLELSFDYSTTDANESLYIHIWGYVENATASSSNTFMMNLGASNGNAWESSGGVFDQYNLTDEALGLGPASTAVQLTGATGNQSYNETFDISTFTSGPNKLSEYDYIVIGLARNEPGDGSTSSLKIDNFSLVANIPEPSSVILFGCVLSVLGFNRRRVSSP